MKWDDNSCPNEQILKSGKTPDTRYSGEEEGKGRGITEHAVKLDGLTCRKTATTERNEGCDRRWT